MAECTMKFGEAYHRIRNMGADAVNPLAVVSNWHTPWVDAMRECVRELMTCDAVYALPDYTDSKGAMIETDLALKMHMPVYHSLKELQRAVNKHA